jgi:transposase
VEPYRKTYKNDFIDAEAIAEAVTKQNMRFVQIKSQEQLDIQAMHRVRDRLVQRRTCTDQRDSWLPAGSRSHLRGTTHPSSLKPANRHSSC